MADNAETSPARKLNRVRLLASMLDGFAIFVATFVVVWPIARALLSTDPAAHDPSNAVVFILVGWGGALLLGAVAELIRKLDEALEALRLGGGAGTSSDGGIDPHTQTARRMLVSLDELGRVMREVRDVTLLDDAQRAQRLAIQGEQAVEQLQREVPALLNEHGWVEARRRVQQARERFPGLSAWDGLEAKIEEVRASVEARDVEAAKRQIQDLSALGAWERARDVIRDLLDRHPGCKAAQDLAVWVKRERQKAEAEARARLMAQAQDAARRREWGEALQLANVIVREYPHSPEADALRQQLPTLTENAEIQTRQRMEAEVRELLHEHRYEEAVRIARAIVEQYPKSPQAAVLREQLPRLEQKAGRTRGK